MPVLPGAEPFAFDGGPVGVLLVHGFTGTPQSLREWGETLAAAGLTVRCPRLPGHGTRWQDMNATRFEDWYAEAERGYLQLRERCSHVFVMGLSMGGTITLRLAELHEPDGIVVVNASLLTEDKAARLLPLLKHVLPGYKGVANDVKAEGVTELAYDRVPVRAAASLALWWPKVAADLGRITCPALVFRSAVDHVVPASSTRLLLAQIGSDDVVEQVLPDSYHVATLDNDRHTIFEGSLALVRRVAGAAAAPAASTPALSTPGPSKAAAAKPAARKPATRKPAATKAPVRTSAASSTTGAKAPAKAPAKAAAASRAKARPTPR